MIIPPQTWQARTPAVPSSSHCPSTSGWRRAVHGTSLWFQEQTKSISSSSHHSSELTDLRWMTVPREPFDAPRHTPLEESPLGPRHFTSRSRASPSSSTSWYCGSLSQNRSSSCRSVPCPKPREASATNHDNMQESSFRVRSAAFYHNQLAYRVPNKARRIKATCPGLQTPRGM